MTRMTWNPEQEAYLAANYTTMHPRDIAEHLGCATKAVYSKAGAMGLRRPVKVKPEPKSRPEPYVRRRMPEHVREILMGGELY